MQGHGRIVENKQNLFNVLTKPCSIYDRYVNLELVCLSETTVLKVLGDSGAAILIKVSNGRK